MLFTFYFPIFLGGKFLCTKLSSGLRIFRSAFGVIGDKYFS